MLKDENIFHVQIISFQPWLVQSLITHQYIFHTKQVFTTRPPLPSSITLLLNPHSLPPKINEQINQVIVLTDHSSTICIIFQSINRVIHNRQLTPQCNPSPQCVTVHPMPKFRSCHKAIMVITGRAHCYTCVLEGTLLYVCKVIHLYFSIKLSLPNSDFYDR